MHVETYLNDFSSSAQVKIQVKFNFELFWRKKNQIFWFPCCSSREDLSVDVSITYVGLILTKPGRFLLSAYGNSGYGQNSISSISNFLKKFHISGFPWCRTREDHSIDVTITNVGPILTKLRWFQLFVKSQNSNFELFEKKYQIFGFPWCSTLEDLSIDVSITNVGLILTKLWYLFSGCGQTDRQTDGRTDRRTDRHGFGILTWKHVGTQKISTQSSKLVVSRWSLYASPEVGDA